MKTLKKHQLTRLQKLAVKVKGLIKEAEYKEEYKEATRLHEIKFQLTQLVFKHKL